MSEKQEQRADSPRRKAWEDWKRTLPEATRETLLEMSAAHVAWNGNQRGPAGPPSVEEVPPVVPSASPQPKMMIVPPPVVNLSVPNTRGYLRAIVVLLALILLTLLFVPRAHAQFSKITYIQFEQSGTPITNGFFSYPFTANCIGSLTCSVIAGKMTLNAGAAGSVAWNLITAPAGNLSLAHAAWTTTNTWNATTGAGVNLFRGTDTASNTGTGYLFDWGTAALSALKRKSVV